MDFSQLLSSGFQFLNLDDACEAEVDILTDMLFKHQDLTQLSKLFHLKFFPDGDSSYSTYYTLEQIQLGLPLEHGELGEGVPSPDACIGDQHQQGLGGEIREAVVVTTDASIPIANGPLMPLSPQQHHIISMEANPGECTPSGEMNPPMMPSLPQPLRSYYSQQHVPVVHGSPQGQVSSPGVGQPHGQVGIVNPGYPHVSVPIPMHQQQLIMMQAQPQAGQPYVNLQPLHYVPPQRHHGHPTHGYVQGEHPLSPESVQYHHNPNLIKVTHDPSQQHLQHTHPSNASPQGGPNKYSNGPRKNHSRSIDRNRRNDPEMMNSYPTYYPGIAYPNVYYNQQLAHNVTGSPIIMQSGSHHNKAVPVTMYSTYVASHQYTSPPPPNVQAQITPNTTPPELQQPLVIPSSESSSVVGSHMHPPIPATPPIDNTPPQDVEESANLQVVAPVPQVHPDQYADVVPSQVDNESAGVVSEGKTIQGDKQLERTADSVVTVVESDENKQLGSFSTKSGPSHTTNRKKVQQEVNPSSAPSSTEGKGVNSSLPNQQESKQVNRSSPVPDQVVKKSMNKCSSPHPSEEYRVPPPPSTTAGSSSAVASTTSTPTAPPQPKPQTWAETSAPKPQRINNNNNSNVNSGSSSSADDKTLKEKQGQTKSAEFPALARMNINGNSSASGSGGASAPPGRSWASICKNPNASGPITTTNGSGAGLGSTHAAQSTSGNSVHGVSSEHDVGGVSTNNSNGSVGGTGSSDKSNVSQNAVVSSDNNGHVNVPTPSQSSNLNDKSKSPGVASSDPPFDPSCLNNENDSLAIRLGEFLANYALDHHATALTPRGLTNQSNYCYINATLQALMACPPFVNLFRSMRDVGLAKTPCKATPIIQSVFDFVSEFEPLNRGNANKRDRRSESFISGANLEPSGIRKVLGLLDGSTFKAEGRQQDAEEFLSHLLNGLHDEMIKVIKWYENSKLGPGMAPPIPPQQQQTGVSNGQHPEGAGEEDEEDDHWQVMGPKNKGCLTRKTNVMKSPISEMLFGQLCSALHRTNSFKSATLQPFFTLQLDIQSDTVRSVRDALEGLSFKEEVSGLVSNSGQETEAWRQLSLEELPMILILHLKRFVYDKSGHKIQKLDKKLEFGIDLEIAKELLSVSTRGKCTLKQRQYKLFAVVYHDGEEAYKGHYIADCFHPSGGNVWGQVGWLRYDDIAVKPIAENHMLNSQPPRVPYLLYYRRADTLLSHHVQIPRNKDRPRNFGSVDS